MLIPLVGVVSYPYSLVFVWRQLESAFFGAVGFGLLLPIYAAERIVDYGEGSVRESDGIYAGIIVG